MDESPICYAIVNKRTYSAKGVKEVVGRTSLDAKKRVTCVLEVTASGKKLKTMIIYRAAPNGPVSEEVQEFSNEGIHHCQQNAWMDMPTVEDWFHTILKSFIKNRCKPRNVMPIVFLDQFSVHMNEDIMQKIINLGFEVAKIPKGCTGMSQYIDISIGKPLNDKYRELCEDWLIDVIKHNEDPCISCNLVSE
jgi:DDE superfamily endonuclease